ncbi:MAG: AIR synthase-related protein [Candidatus ainarchaeum sp.]|nr:AIR synthase-related protein [Candidatus ainarchaeum sp.]
MKYKDFVDYSKLDPVKAAAIEKFSGTISNPKRLGIKIAEGTIGEPAIAFELPEQDFFLAFNVEGLGTKNLIADAMCNDKRGKGAKYYEGVGIDNVAMSTNDLAAIGADAIVYGDIISSGNSAWFDGNDKIKFLFEGFRKAADEIGMAIPCGETPTLQGIVNPETLDIAGASVGIIQPKTRLVFGKDISEGDLIIGLESSGLHSNGISLARKVAESLPDGYFFEIPETGNFLGEEILKPTRLYTRPLIEMLEKTELHYLAPITGHGWKKIMRAKKPFSYEIHSLPEPAGIFRFLQEKAKISDEEAYSTWNMGIGYAIIAPEKSSEAIKKIAQKYKINSFELGSVCRGEKKVVIRQKKIVFQP